MPQTFYLLSRTDIGLSHNITAFVCRTTLRLHVHRPPSSHRDSCSTTHSHTFVSPYARYTYHMDL
ncbi:hypothetical protein B0H19DRAFT_1173685, partial [Mycena capillaripes]